MTAEAFLQLPSPFWDDCGQARQARQAVQRKLVVSEQVGALALVGFFTCQNSIFQIQR
jgi:hypothetical protein